MRESWEDVPLTCCKRVKIGVGEIVNHVAVIVLFRGGGRGGLCRQRETSRHGGVQCRLGWHLLFQFFFWFHGISIAIGSCIHSAQVSSANIVHELVVVDVFVASVGVGGEMLEDLWQEGRASLTTNAVHREIGEVIRVDVARHEESERRDTFHKVADATVERLGCIRVDGSWTRWRGSLWGSYPCW